MNDRDTSERRPRMPEVVRRTVDGRIRQIFNWLPGKVTSYDSSKGQVDVQPLLQDAYIDENDERQVESLPVVPAIPVLFYGSADMCITVPISDGNLQLNGKTVAATIGIILFCGRSLDKWLSGQGQEVDPQIDHEHADTDAVFIPGLNPFGGPLSVCPTDAMTFGSQTDGNARLVAKPGTGLQLGDGATKGVVRKGDKTAGHKHVIKASQLSNIIGTAGPYTVSYMDGPSDCNTESATDKADECSAKITAVD